MILHRILDYSHLLIKQAVTEGDIVVDGTCGNGHDTLFLANLVGENGHVFGFDIQKEAIENTASRLTEEGVINRTTIIYGSHTELDQHIPNEHKGNIQAAIYNLGYLPGSDKSIVTKPEETIKSLNTLLSLLKKGGLVVLVVYHGHPGGQEEKEAVLEYVSALDSKAFHVLNYGFINQKRHPPFIVAIEKH